MFTGLIFGIAQITERKMSSRDCSLTLSPSFQWDSPLEEGESISVSGVCLTVTKALSKGAFSAYASEETLKRSTLASAKLVNLERALKLTDRLGGHLLTGHVDTLATLTERKSAGKSLVLAIRFPVEFSLHVAPKGSIALDGVSLTVNTASPGTLTVNVIPETLERTTLKDLKIGASLNLETDILAKYLESLLSSKKEPSPGLRKLLEEGF
ncbi:MAG: riboflavin synthase [Deltaproteobacteria bacterium]|jgi:riboflavin synthase|nr:riboflavin synthase [Deltaproteobacteria bacterium]